MLKFEHVTKVYGGKKALNDLTLSFLPGHVYALVGPNGSGKSTMMKVAAGLVKPNSGSATYQEMPIGVESKKHIAYMCTEPFYYDYMKIQDVKQFYADFFADFDKERFDSLLQFMQLTLDMKVRSLSSGMAAKLKIAATLARNADICMLDEPLNGIDLVGRDQIIQSILRAANPNATILISSHLFDELEPIVDHIVMMANGSLILEGELESPFRICTGNIFPELLHPRGFRITQINPLSEYRKGDHTHGNFIKIRISPLPHNFPGNHRRYASGRIGLSGRILHKGTGTLYSWSDRRHSLSGTGSSCNSAVRRYHV